MARTIAICESSPGPINLLRFNPLVRVAYHCFKRRVEIQQGIYRSIIHDAADGYFGDSAQQHVHSDVYLLTDFEIRDL